jgi:hypothetical protein
MKKILALVSFLVIAAACTNEPATNSNPPVNANPTTTKAAAPSEAEMVARETAVWDTLKKKDYDGFGNALASDYLEVTDQGVIDKAGIVAEVKDLAVTDATYSDWKMLPIDNDAVILTYTLNLKASYKGAEIPAGPYRAAAAWVNRDGKWVAFYYQQTPVKPAMPMPSPAKTASPAKPETAASPAAKPGETGPDPIANEKIVWDTFRSRNYGAFAAVLDPAFIEIEPDMVYDKAASVKAVAGMDAAEFELSEWKSAKLDNDAALVTYLVTPKDPKWGIDRHTSIWVNRGGKWVALLHMGTPMRKADAKPAKK